MTSKLTFMPICFTYFLKFTDTAPRAPITTGSHMPDFLQFHLSVVCISLAAQVPYLSPCHCLGWQHQFLTTSLSLFIKTMSGLLASIFRSHWTVKPHSILEFSLSTTPSGFCSYQLLALSNPHLPQSCQWIYILCQLSVTISALLPHILHKGDSAVPGRFISLPQYILSNLLLQSTAKF